MKNRTACPLSTLLGLAFLCTLGTAANVSAQMRRDSSTERPRTGALFFGSLDESGTQTQAPQQQQRQQPTPSPTPPPEDTQPSTPAAENRTSDYTVISGIELGARAAR